MLYVFHFSQSGLIVTFVWMKKINWRKKACYMKVLWVHWNVFGEVGYIKVISHYANCWLTWFFGNMVLCYLFFIQGCLQEWTYSVCVIEINYQIVRPNIKMGCTSFWCHHFRQFFLVQHVILAETVIHKMQ